MSLASLSTESRLKLLDRYFAELDRKNEELQAKMRFYRWCGDNSHSIGETLDRLAHHGFRNYKTLRFYVKRFFAVFYRKLPGRSV